MDGASGGRAAIEKAADEAAGLITAAEGAVIRLQQDIAALRAGDLGTEARAKHARLWATALEDLALAIREALTPKCHECGETVAFGERCCGKCWHTSTESGRCEGVADAAE